MVNWPAIIKLSDEAELIYVRDQTQWYREELHHVDFDETDHLIDSSGHIFTLLGRVNNCVNPEPAGKVMTLHEILGLIKAHAAQKGSCCVAKLYARTIKEAFKIAESLSET